MKTTCEPGLSDRLQRTDLDSVRRKALSRRALQRLRDSRSTLFVSLVSLWEILLKHQPGKLWADVDIRTVLQSISGDMNWNIVELSFEHILAAAGLPRFSDHKDPFDRLLIAQALHENLAVVTADAQFARYGVKVIW